MQVNYSSSSPLFDHMFSQDDDNPCTLLLNVDNAVKAVARGAVLFPRNRSFHTVPIDDNMHRVRVDRSLPGCGDLYPPTQPPENDGMLKVGQLKNKILLWPKALIRLNTVSRSEASRGRVNPEAAPGPSSQARVTPMTEPAATKDRVSPPPADDPLEPE